MGESLARRAHRVARRNLVVSFAVGLMLALSTSGGILWERVSFGDPAVVIAAGCWMALTARVLLLQTRHALSIVFLSPPAPQWSSALFSLQTRRLEHVYGLKGDTIVAAQALGALAGVSIVHAFVQLGPFSGMGWLSARPALLVNDGTAAISLIVFVWALAMNHDTPLLVGVLLLMTVFDMTARHWAVDRAHQLFAVSVQQALLVQFALIALSLLAIQSRRSATR